ncbi:hypothetical protein Nepgr_029552 [Nepenthes gracilis]|uniref:WRKY domain-containing protein n=1 Tax=Nepenthes gracilis TaxID=150966 RepID=A0AAD3TEL8_NEPGR|nr:hypothetical protein Nepgr_029552 [Nepenthes gracilis]
MENYQGDLTDIIRASAGTLLGSGSRASDDPTTTVYSQFHMDNQFEFSDFGDPFSNARDPLLHDLEDGIGSSGSSSSFFFSPSPPIKPTGGEETSNGNLKIEDQEMKVNVFSRMFQISAVNVATTAGDPVPLLAADPSPPNHSNNNDDDGVLVNSNCTNYSMGQISPPRNPALKRRKSQAKKVVCIPAPAAANSRQGGGEVVPSDLWAWRKYGQKPIKGSPYPRGYYRCSSSKGCSARKQVERSRTDPNMLVITYTSEHNHPWPTQRNSLAGSTRSHHHHPSSKPTATTAAAAAKERSTLSMKDSETNNSTMLVTATAEHHETNGTSSTSSIYKEETNNRNGDQKQIEVEADHHDDHLNEEYFDYESTYRPAAATADDPQDLFAELGDLFFSQSFSESAGKEIKELDPFSGLFDWAGNNSKSS